MVAYSKMADNQVDGIFQLINNNDPNKKYWESINQATKRIKNKPYIGNENELRRLCKQASKTLLEAINMKQKEQDSEAPKIYKLSPSMVRNLFLNSFYCYLFDKNEKTRVAFYNPLEGIYTRNYGTLKRFLSFFEPRLDEREANNAIYQIKNYVNYKDPDNSGRYIAVGNGIFDLQTKKKYDFSPEYILTSKIATKYYDDVKSPKIDGWNVDEWFNELARGDANEVKLFWQIIYDVINPNLTHDKSIWLVGTMQGNNGKGTFQKLLENVVGKNNCVLLKVEEFEKRFALENIDGKSLIVGDDTQASYIENTSNFNSIVTGDPVSIEKKGEAPYQAVVNATIVQSCNTMPTFAKKGGTYRRLLLVPFKATFKETNDNKKIKKKYIARKDVLEYILCKALKVKPFDNFIEPEPSLNMKKEFIAENDSIAGFKTDIFDEGNFERIPVYLLHLWYKNYCKKHGFIPVKNPRKFNNYFAELVSPQYKKKSSMRLSKEHKDKIRQYNEECRVNNFGCFYIQKPFEKENYTCLYKVDKE